MEVDAGAAAGCCVDDNAFPSVGVQVFFEATGPGSLTVSLETPDMQSQELGVATNSFFLYSDAIFGGKAVGGVWKLTFLASPDADGWSSSLFSLNFFVEQCVYN